MEQRWIDAARRGDKDAFRRLVERYQRRVFALALSLLRDRDDAMDVCQETFLRVHRGLASFAGDSQFFTWVYRIAHNLCIDHLRRRRCEAVSLEATHEDVPEDPDRLGVDPIRNLANDELREHLLAALDTLSPAHRAVLTLREVEGLSYKEIAQVVGCSIGTVMSRLFHARRNLLEALRERGGVELDLAA